jgi:hypothetical protein
MKNGANDLVGAAEIAERQVVKRPQIVPEYKRRHRDFPPPIATLKTSLICNWRDFERWEIVTKRF